MPLRIHDRVVVVQRSSSTSRIHRGDWIAYSLTEHSRNNVVAISGFGFGPILAIGGDRVRFTKTGFEINGLPHPPFPHMPTDGEIIISEKTWFIWPDFDISGGHGYVPEADISATLMQLATIQEEQFVGKPFKRWFGRRQIAY